jgi:hypothetical protein
MVLNEQGIYDKHWSWNIVGLNFEFLLVLNNDDVTWDCPEGEVLGKKISLLDTQFWKSKDSHRYFVVKNHKFCFWYTIHVYLFLFHFNRTWNVVIIPVEFLVK